MEYHSGGSLPLLGRPRYCPGAKANGGYLCETGHCCGETGCCTYYYELWCKLVLLHFSMLISCLNPFLALLLTCNEQKHRSSLCCSAAASFSRWCNCDSQRGSCSAELPVTNRVLVKVKVTAASGCPGSKPLTESTNAGEAPVNMTPTSLVLPIFVFKR